jgi:predicted nucleic acid-binding protein
VGSAAVRLLLDSVIVIDHFNGIDAATRYLAANGADAAVSVITRAEALTGFEPPAMKRAAEFLDCFPALAIDQPIADRAAALRRSEGWKLPDAFQAAIAERHGLQLVTRNRRDFSPRRHPFVVIPYRL